MYRKFFSPDGSTTISFLRTSPHSEIAVGLCYSEVLHMNGVGL